VNFIYQTFQTRIPPDQNRTRCHPTTKITLLIMPGPVVSVYLKKHTNKLCKCVGKQIYKQCVQSTGCLMSEQV
jgi:hypothetical protein